MMSAQRPIMIREDPTQRAPPPGQSYPAEKARGGEIILRTPLRRMIFLGGLIGVAIVALALAFWG
jgi:hypothetical protein